MLSPPTAIFFALLGSFIFHLVPVSWARTRLGIIAALSFFIVFSYYPLAAVAATASSIVAYFVLRLSANSHLVAKYGPLTLLAFLVIGNSGDMTVQTDPYSSTLITFGMSFYILRLYLMLRTAIAKKESLTLVEVLNIALFFPIFPAGPICAQEAFQCRAFSGKELFSNYALGFMRIGVGLLALYVFVGILDDALNELSNSRSDRIRWSQVDEWGVYPIMLLSFTKLYANFVGYTEIAIGLGLFFGFKIPENFRYPFLATNIQRFWQRWHLSLSKFITQQIYLPLMLWLRKPKLSIFLAFVLVGLWHDINWQYLVWGVGHGAALVMTMYLSKHERFLLVTAKIPGPLRVSLSWLLTMSLVSFLSTFANQPRIQDSLSFTLALLGLR